MSKKSHTYTKVKGNTTQSYNNTKPKKKKWDKTHTVVFILILFWSIGSILGSIGFVNSCNSKNVTANVAYADTVVQDNNFTFNSVPINFSVPCDIVAKDNTTGTLLTFRQNNVLLDDMPYTFTLNFGDLYRGVYNTSTVTFNDYNFVSLQDNIQSFTNFQATGFSTLFAGTNVLTFNVCLNNNNPINRTLFLSDKSRFTLLDLVKYNNRNTFPTITPYLTSSNAYIYVVGFDTLFTSTEFYKVRIQKYANPNPTTNPYQYFDRYTYYNLNEETFSIFVNYPIPNIYQSEPFHFVDYYRYITTSFDDNNIYQTAYQEGYNNGIPVGYDNGYTDGLEVGKNVGYYDGLQEGIQQGADGRYSFLGLLSAVIDAPIQAISGLLEFEILGINFSNFFFGIMTACLFIAVCKFVLKSVV